MAETNLGSFDGTGPFMNTTSIVGGGSDGAGVGGLFSSLVSTVLGFLTILAGMAFLLYFLLGAIGWITSGGDKTKVDKSRDQMTSAAIGLVAVIAAYTITGIVSVVLGIDILDPTAALQAIIPGGN